MAAAAAAAAVAAKGKENDSLSSEPCLSPEPLLCAAGCTDHTSYDCEDQPHMIAYRSGDTKKMHLCMDAIVDTTGAGYALRPDRIILISNASPSSGRTGQLLEDALYTANVEAFEFWLLAAQRNRTWKLFLEDAINAFASKSCACAADLVLNVALVKLHSPGLKSAAVDVFRRLMRIFYQLCNSGYLSLSRDDSKVPIRSLMTLVELYRSNQDDCEVTDTGGRGLRVHNLLYVTCEIIAQLSTRDVRASWFVDTTTSSSSDDEKKHGSGHAMALSMENLHVFPTCIASLLCPNWEQHKEYQTIFCIAPYDDDDDDDTLLEPETTSDTYKATRPHARKRPNSSSTPYGRKRKARKTSSSSSPTNDPDKRGPILSIMRFLYGHPWMS